MTEKRDLAARVRQAVKETGITQTHLAGQIGISTKHLSSLLTGRTPMSMAWAERILAACSHRVEVVIEPLAPRPPDLVDDGQQLATVAVLLEALGAYRDADGDIVLSGSGAYLRYHGHGPGGHWRSSY